MSSRDTGTNEERIEAIRNQIINWANQTNFEAARGGEVDRAIDEFDFMAEIDPQQSASWNWENFKNEVGLITQTDFDQMVRDAEDRAVDALRDEIRAQIREFGLFDVTDAIVGNPAPQPLEERVGDVLEEFPPDVYDGVIREQVGDILDVLGDDFRVIESHRLRDLRDRAERGEVGADAREEVLLELSRSFGQQFDSIDAAVRSLRERIASARGERLQIAPIQARRSGGDVLVRIADGDVFTEFTNLVTRRVRRGIAFPPEQPRTWREVGEIRIRGGELEAISLEAGVEQFGRPEETDVPIVEEIEREQAALPDEEISEADRLADMAIDLLEGD